MMKLFSVLFLLFCCCLHVHGSSNNATTQQYIVYMGKKGAFPNSESLISANHDMLASVMGSLDEARQATVHHYHKSFRGFSAMFTPEQADQIANHSEVVSVFKSQVLDLHTTRTWTFMGARPKSYYSSLANYKDYDVIVGHFDSGVWPEHSSFNPEGLGPVPSRFRGECETGEAFSSRHCNRKLIGARYYYRGFERDMGSLSQGFHFLSPRDDYNHGTHTASIAVGSVVSNLTYDFFGGETNTIRGGAPYARLAVYKTCWFNKCSCADITKAFDDAIHDNVDIISVSLGQPGTETDFMKDCFSLGALHAFQNGILVTASGGNYAEPYTVSNAAPWILTVAASSINREFISEVELGNGVLVKGFAHNNDHQNSFGTIVTGRSAANEDARPEDASACKWNSLDYSRIQRKVVVCTMENWDDDKVQKSQVIADAGGRGLIIVDPYEYTQTNLGEYRLPTSVVSQEVGDKLDDYMGYYRHTALIHDTKVHFRGIKEPRMAYFSSKGPGSAPDIIKPDITAPGLNIFGAWPPSHNPNDPRDQWYNLQSGTSMACPHVSGVAAVLKGIHRKLSPAEVKSAIMTSARTTDRFGEEPIQAGERDATPFDFGSGHLRPNDALRPGLVYDFNTADVIAYLCSAGVSNWQLQNLVGEDVSCPHSPVPTYNLNYPSIAVSNMKAPTRVTRTVTYLGRGTDPKKFYLDVEQPEGVNLKVQPDTLDFSDGRRTMTYTVDIQVKKRHKKGKYLFGSITWYNDRHNVRSPVAIRAV